MKSRDPVLYRPRVRRMLSMGQIVWGSFATPANLVLDPEPTLLRFEYSMPHMGDAVRVSYQTRLVGLDERWQDWAKESYRDFTALREGTYRFEIRARDALGRVRPSPGLAFSIRPPWFRTWWAYTLFVVLIAMSLHSFVRRRVRLSRVRVSEIEQRFAEKQMADAALRESEARYRTLVEHAGHAIVVFDAELGRFVDANSDAERLFGYSREELLTKSPAQVSPRVQAGGSLSAEAAATVVQATLAGDAPTFEWTHRNAAGNDIPCEVRLVRLPSGDRNLVRGTILDISARKKADAEAERQRERLVEADKMIALGTLVSGVAHEVNNPNHFIMLNLPILKDAWRDVLPILDDYSRKDPDLRLANIPYDEIRADLPALLDEIVNGAERIRHIVGELRSYSSRRAPDSTEPVDINQVVRSALTLLTSQIKKATSCFSVEYGKDIPDCEGNGHRLEQVVINLILNACQSLTDSGDAVAIQTSFDAGSETIVLSVRDEGTGIAGEHLPHLMDPFYTTKRDAGGTGLGLAVVARIVEEHGARLDFASTVGEGTTATLRLPAHVEAVVS